jgi:hypothetical protein
MYEPCPIDTSNIKLPIDFDDLLERLAKHTHDVWARRRMSEGWSFGDQRNDATKEHPCLVPYIQLPDSEKEYDRTISIETLKAIIALGYQITKVDSP